MSCGFMSSHEPVTGSAQVPGEDSPSSIWPERTSFLFSAEHFRSLSPLPQHCIRFWKYSLVTAARP